MAARAALTGPGLPRVVGHEELQDRVREALRERRIPQSLLLQGPPGVGKRSLALWTAGLLQCDAPEAPCRECRSCRLAARFEHPDIHYHFPMPRPKRASSRAKLREKVEELRQERLERLREEPDEPLDEGEVTGIYLAAVEEIRAQAARRPAMGSKAVFVVAEAEAMVPQSANPEAANAFLKLLEEPPGYVHLILTTARPAALLPTIRSRAATLRVPPLPDERIARHLRDAGVPADEAEITARLARGSLGRATALLAGAGEEARDRADGLLHAALHGSEADRLQSATGFSARGARSVLADVLVALEERLRDLLCVAAGDPARAADRDATRRTLRGGRLEPDAVVRAIEAVERARGSASRNVNPQATVALLLLEMADRLTLRPAGSDPGGDRRA